MRRYSYYPRHGLNYDWLNPTFVFPSEEKRSQFAEASEILHWFSVDKRGRKKGRVDMRIDGPDTDFMIINIIMHCYCLSKYLVVRPESFASVLTSEFDMLIEVEDEEERQNIIEMSLYLQNWGVWGKGKGTKKPGSRVWLTLPDNNEVITFLKQLHTQPEKIIVVPFVTKDLST